MTPEEKLCRESFCESFRLRRYGLRLPPGVQERPSDLARVHRHGVEKDERALAIEREEIDRLQVPATTSAILDRNVDGRLAERLEFRQQSRTEGL